MCLILNDRKISDEDLSFITDRDSVNYVKNVIKQNSNFDIKKKNTGSVPSQIISILNSMIEFNPFFRKDAATLLKDPIFDKFRNKENEITCPTKIVFKYDEPDSFDYLNILPLTYTKKDIFTSLIKEISEEINYK